MRHDLKGERPVVGGVEDFWVKRTSHRVRVISSKFIGKVVENIKMYE